MKTAKIILILFGVAANIAFLYLNDKLGLFSVVLTLIFFSIASAIHLALHECGHLIGGFVSGYKLVCVQIGPITVTTDRANMVSLSIKSTRGGQCIMVPRAGKPLHFIAYNLGGVIANAAVCVAGGLILWSHSFYATLFFMELIFAGLLKVAANLIPCLIRSIPNDGYVVKLLSHNPAVQRDYAIYLSLYAALFWGENVIPSDYVYQRNAALNRDELIYYNGIQELIASAENSDSIKNESCII